MTEMRAIGWPRAGSSEPSRVLEVATPESGPGQVKVRVAWSAINQADLKVASGQFVGRFLHARVSPLVVGYDFSGYIEGGAELGDLKIGDEVFGFLPYGSATRQGAFAEFVVVDRGAIGRKPQGVSHETAATAATAGLTALQFLRDFGRMRTGSRVLILGAAGGVGSFAVWIAKRLGAHVTAVCSAYATDYVRGLGADVVVDRHKQDPTGLKGPFDVVFDPAASYSYFAFGRRILPGGTFVSTVPTPSLILGKAIATLSHRRCEFGSVRPVSADIEQLAAWLESGLQVPIVARFHAKNLDAAFAQVAKGQMCGRVAIQVEGGF